MLSSDFFNILIEKIICAADLRYSEEARSIGLAVNESKTKYLASAAKGSSIGESVEIDGYNFEVVKDSVYLGSSIKSQSGNQT